MYCCCYIKKKSIECHFSEFVQLNLHLHKNFWIETKCWSIYRNFLEEDHNLVAPLLDDLMIFFYIAHYFFPVVCSTRWFTVAPTSHCLGRCEYSAPELFCTYCVRAFSLLSWPLAHWLLTAALTRFSTKNVKSWNTWDVSFRKNCFGLLCMHTLQWNTQCSYNLTHAEHRGCC